MPDSCTPGRARSNGSLAANHFQDVGSAQKPDQHDFPASRNYHMNRRTDSCVSCCRRRLCALRPAAVQGITVHDVSNIVLIALDVLIQAMRLVLSKPDSTVQCPVSPDLRSRYLGWIQMYYDTHRVQSSHNDTGGKGTTDVSIVNHHRAHTSAMNVRYQLELEDERIKCLPLMRLFHIIFKAGLFVGLNSRTVEIRPRMLQSERPTLSNSHVAMTTLRDTGNCALDHSVLPQQDASVQARVIWPSICGILNHRESDIRGQSNEMTKITSLVQNGDESTKKAGGYSDQGQEKHRPDTQQHQRSSTWPAMRKRARQAESDKSQDDDERKEPGPGDSYKKRSLDNEKIPKFACPFFKNNPGRYAEERACCGPGWASVNRVKEHLYRRHRLPNYYCTRCFSIFRNLGDMNRHHRQEKACEVQDKSPIIDGLDQETLSRLKMRSKKPPPISPSLSAEEQKWYSMYSIIFPGHTSVTSPYYEPEEKGLSILPSEAVAEEIFRKNLQETLPTWILEDSTIIDSIMCGSISAFNKTFTAIHGQGTSLLPDASTLEATTSLTAATSAVDRQLTVSGEARKTELVDDTSLPSLMTPEDDYMAPRSVNGHYNHYIQSLMHQQTSGDKAETTEPPVQPPTYIGSWQPGSLPPPFPSLPAYEPSLTPQDDWSLHGITMGFGQQRDGWAVELAHLSSSTSGQQDKNIFDLE
ncbi:hypothetical protein DER45DRAFT_569986 [Fusarium avenaceum]|nr:hypothetical protein DER45DRAFT_569986 [Fusarium avenaceum]